MQNTLLRFGITLALFGFILSTGCASTGREFSKAAVHQIVIGSTNQEEIRSMFGAPWRTGLEDGKTTWTYGSYSYQVFGPPHASDLLIRFDANGVVSSYSYSTTNFEN